MDRFPFLATFFMLILQGIMCSSQVSHSLNIFAYGKRAYDDSLTTPRALKRKTVVWAPSPQIDHESNPPDLFLSISDPIYLKFQPENIRTFLEFFHKSWSAHANNFVGTDGNEFELLQWERNEVIQSISFAIHVNFLIQILGREGIHKVEKFWDLMVEYIDYLFRRKDCKLTSDQYLTLAVSCVKTLNPPCFKVILDKLPKSELPASFPVSIWDQIVATSLRLNLNGTIGRSSMFEIIYEMTRVFGPYSIDTEVISAHENASIYQLIKLQPIFHSILSLNCEIFSNQFQVFEKEFDRVILYTWIDKFISFHRRCLNSNSNFDLISSFADTIFESFNSNISEIISQCFDKNLLEIPQFLLLNSSSARSSLPDKSKQCQVLANLFKVNYFDFDYLKMAIIISGFSLSWKDIEEYLNFDGRNELICGLKFLLQVVESAPNLFKNEFWSLDSLPSSSTLNVDTESLYLFDAGRIILFKQFKIPLTWTRTIDDILEEASFQDLVGFMTFFVNKYRPDLGPNFSIKLA